jgi:hypothetical protein
MAGFVQIIEFRSSRIDEIKALSEAYDNRLKGALFRRAVIVADRDRPGVYRNIVEFDSYEVAMQNSQRPETSDFAARMAELCDGPPSFANLDVIAIMEPVPAI